MNKNNYEEMLFLCAKTIVLFEICQCMAEKRKPKQEQIKRLSIQIAKKVSTKRNTIQTLNYLYHKKHLTGFINFV